MGWRQNMEVKSKNEPLRPYMQKVQKVQKAEKELKKDAFAPFAYIALRVQKVKTPEIIIKKMSNCLHGKPCIFIKLENDRQICSKNNQPIFDMTVCPVGKWWTPKLMDKAKANTMQPTRCFCCGGQTRKITEAGAGYAASVIRQCCQKIR